MNNCTSVEFGVYKQTEAVHHDGDYNDRVKSLSITQLKENWEVQQHQQQQQQRIKKERKPILCHESNSTTQHMVYGIYLKYDTIYMIYKIEIIYYLLIFY